MISEDTTHLNSECAIVVATDGSAQAERIIPHAGRWQAARGAGLVLLRVLDARDDAHPEPGESLQMALQRARNRVQEELHASLARAGVQGDVRVELPKPGEKTAAAILRSAQQAELLALGSRGRGGLGHLLHGSVAWEVVAGTSMPVMLGGPSLGGPLVTRGAYHLLVTSDGSSASSDVLRAIAPLLETEQRFRLTLLHVHERLPLGKDDEVHLAHMSQILEAQRRLLPSSLQVDTVLPTIPRGAGTDTAIIEQARHLDADAIAISTHGYSAQRHLFMGSVASSILRRSPLPLIVARA